MQSLKPISAWHSNYFDAFMELHFQQFIDMVKPIPLL